jgi:hypothetical protein
MRGGMTMVGDMFDQGLKSKIDGLCSALSQLLAQQPFAPPVAGSQSQGSGQQGTAAGSASLFVPEAFGRAFGQWWPAELGSPNGSGAGPLCVFQRIASTGRGVERTRYRL